MFTQDLRRYRNCNRVHRPIPSYRASLVASPSTQGVYVKTFKSGGYSLRGNSPSLGEEARGDLFRKETTEFYEFRNARPSPAGGANAQTVSQPTRVTRAPWRRQSEEPTVCNRWSASIFRNPSAVIFALLYRVID
ncbi:hypothetical protein CDAR_222021 [Caerostris darwini]|uniref:Uncharacterized protein n=1 Tax=Caerostris darwini TaxID=1538125 RepID=A0AAV4W0Q5_9ARAC|nr:hypothetical protein CDAR_222021 [Caerostris darwini]